MPKYIVWRTTTYEQEQEVIASSEADAVEKARLYNEWVPPVDQEETYQAQWIGDEWYE